MSSPNFAWNREPAPSEASPMTVFPSSFALHPDRLFPADSATRDTARRLYASVAGLPILSPHGHTDPQWFADDAPFPDPARLFIVPDHYVHRMLHSQGLRLEDLGVPRIDGGPIETDSRKIWRRFAENFHLFAARRRRCGSTTPSPKSSAFTSASAPGTPTGPTITSPP